MIDNDLGIIITKQSAIQSWSLQSYEFTSGSPSGDTVGPCNEWQETISTSGGRYFSNAARSGALTDVCPPTIAPTFVAARQKFT